MAEPEVNNTTVLYVEDDENDVLLMQMAFRRAGLASTLRIVETGQAAIDYLSGAGEFAERSRFPVPQLVLLDLNLPILPGFDVLRWMKQQPLVSELPVVIFSSSSRDEDKATARELGALEYVEKPQTIGKFGDLVQRLRQKFLGHCC